MERPSHITLDTRQPWFRRASFIAMTIGLQLVGFWLFTHGLTTHVPNIIRDFVFVQTHEQEKLAVKPPEPEIQKKINVIVVPAPIFGTELPPRPGGAGIAASLPPPTDGGATKPPEHVVRAPMAIMSTHTVPPYPTVSRRMGAEGKVTLRLNVSAEGRVTRAEIVTSSGRDDLDEAAQAWITAHWIYRPAQDNGTPVASQVMAMVTFSLADQR
jgi:periplasmic protein TonB